MLRNDSLEAALMTIAGRKLRLEERSLHPKICQNKRTQVGPSLSLFSN